MSNPRIASILAAISLFPMAAFAEQSVPVSLVIEYDSAALSTNQGAAETMDSITKATIAACQVEQSMTTLAYTDKKCVENLIEQAVQKITTANIEAGMAVAPAFTESAEKIFAAYEQR